MDHAYPAAGEQYVADDLIYVQLGEGEFSRPNNFSLRPYAPMPNPEPMPMPLPPINRLRDTGAEITARAMKIGL